MLNDFFKKSAHDLNNILTSIITGIELLKESPDNNEETQKLISKLENSTKRAIQIVHSHLDPSGKPRNNIDKISVVEIVNEVTESFSQEDQDIIQVNSPNDTPSILINETDFYRIIYNLIKNALEAIDKKGEVAINISTIQVDEKSFVKINIVDNGVGISEENLSKIFEAKFSTKEKEHESGFGLSIVKEKIEEYGGEVKVSSQTGKTEFIILLPAYNKNKKQSSNILIAEDDTSVSEVLADLLKSHGYNVSIAASGYEAIEQINQSIFDALIIDKKMPEMDGIECIKNIRSINSQLPIILASGSDVDLQGDKLQNLNIDLVLKKPYNFPEILSALQKFNL